MSWVAHLLDQQQHSKKKDRWGRAIAGAGAGSAFGPWGAGIGAGIGYFS